MAYVIDLVMLAVIVLLVILKAKKGFVKSVVVAVGIVAAVLLSVTLSGRAAPFVYDHLVAERVDEAMEDTLKADSVSGKDAAQRLCRNQLVRAGLSAAGMTQEDLEQRITDTLENSSQTVVQTVSHKVVRPIVVRLLESLLLVLLLVILIIAVRIVATAVNKLISVTPAGGANTFFGGVLGLLEGFIFALALFALLLLVLDLHPGLFGLERSLAEKTLFYHYCYQQIL